MATINGKSVLLNARYLLMANQTVQERSGIPVDIKIDNQAMGGVQLNYTGSVYELTINGLPPGADIITTGNLVWNGTKGTFLSRAVRIAETSPEPTFDVSITIIAS